MLDRVFASKRVTMGRGVWSLVLLLASGSALAARTAEDSYEIGGRAVGNDHFLGSLGVLTHVGQGYDPDSYVGPLRYLGVRNVRDGVERLQGLIRLHQKTGVRFDIVGSDVGALTSAAKMLSRLNALMAIEGPNEPNNFKITYQGQSGGGNGSWRPVARLQNDLYRAVHADPSLAGVPVFHVSEGGAQTENVGLQFLTIPANAGALLPAGTQFADYANVHNYVSGVTPGYEDNQAWQAASPTLSARWDGLYAEYGKTWQKGFPGYPADQLKSLPRVTTETGWEAAAPAEERRQGIVLVNTYLAQFKRGWRYTFIYEVGDGEGGGGHWGLFHHDWTPKLAATYIHNLTSILADGSPNSGTGTLRYEIGNGAPTVHDLLLRKSDGGFDLVVWGEKVAGTTDIRIDFAASHRNVAVYDITVGVDPVRRLSDVKSLPLSVGDHALIVEIR